VWFNDFLQDFVLCGPFHLRPLFNVAVTRRVKGYIVFVGKYETGRRIMYIYKQYCKDKEIIVQLKNY